MNTITIRQQLHETIENIDDIDLLELVKGILDHKYHSDTAINVSNHQKARIMASINSINSGNFRTEEQAVNSGCLLK